MNYLMEMKAPTSPCSLSEKFSDQSNPVRNPYRWSLESILQLNGSLGPKSLRNAVLCVGFHMFSICSSHVLYMISWVSSRFAGLKKEAMWLQWRKVVLENYQAVFSMCSSCFNVGFFQVFHFLSPSKLVRFAPNLLPSATLSGLHSTSLPRGLIQTRTEDD